MNTDFIDKIVSKEAYQDVERTNALLDELYDKFTKAANAANLMNQSVADATGLQGLAQASEQVNQENEQLLKLQKQIADTITKRNFAESQLAKTLAEEKILLQQANKDNANAAKINLTTAGSIARMEAIVLRLRAKQKDLNLTTEEGQKKSEQYKKAIDKLNESIKANSDAAAKQRLNVGNYQGSAKIIVESLKSVEDQIKKLQERQTGLVELSKRNPIGFRTQGGDKQLGEVNAQLQQLQTNAQALSNIVDKPQFLNIAAKVGDQRAEIGFFRKELINLEDAGLRNSKAYKEVQQRLAQLTDQVADTKDEIKALSSDTRGFDLFAGSVTFAADAFQTFAGAAQLAGASEEDAAKATATLVAVQSVSNGVKGIATELTTKGTAANKLYAFSQRIVTTAIGETTGAARLLRIALLATGIGAIVVGVGLLLANVGKLKDAISGISEEQKNIASNAQKAAEEEDRKLKSLEDQDNVLKLQGKTEEEILKLKISQTAEVIEARKQQLQASQELVKSQIAAAQRNKDILTGLLNWLNIPLRLYLGAIDKVSGAIGLNLNLLEWLDKKTLSIREKVAGMVFDPEQTEEDGKKTIEEQQAVIDELTNRQAGYQLQLKNMNKKGTADAKKEMEKQAVEFEKFLQQLKSQQVQASIEIANTLEQRAIANFQRIASNEQLSLNERLLANTAYYQGQEALINKRVEQEQAALIQEAVLEAERILGRKLTGDELLAIEQATQKQRIALQLKGEDEIVQLRQEGVSRQTELIEQEANRQLAVLARASEQRLQASNLEEQRELQELELQLRAGTITREAYEKKKLDIQNKYIEQRLQAELDAAEEFLKIQKALGVDTTDAEKRIADIKLRLAQELTRSLQEENQKQFDTENQFAQRRKELMTQLYGELKNTLFTFVESSFEKQKNALQNEINLIEERKQKQLAAINAEQISEEEKAAKVQILNAQAENQKRLLEQRQKQVEIQQARFAKVRAAFDIGINTATGISKTIAEFGMPAAIPLIALVSAAGALQLAAVLAQPIPQYYTGTEDAKEGLAWVGERGRELVVTPQGQVWETPDNPTLTYLQAGTKVINNDDYLEMLKSERSNTTLQNIAGSSVALDTANIQLTFKAETDKIVKAIQSKPDAVVNITDYGIELYHKRGMSWTEYLNKRVRFKK